jgi:hypothetical protein
MIDTFMVLWNRDRRRRGFKLFLTFLLICISASLLLATLYAPHLIPFPKMENFTRDFFSKTTLIATATVQADQADLAHKTSLPERARAIELTPTSVAEQPCATSAPTNILHTPQKKHVKHYATKKMVKKVRQRRGSQPLPHQPSKKTSPLKNIPPPKSTLRPTRSSTGPALKPTATHNPAPISTTLVSTPTATPVSVANATATITADTALANATPTATNPTKIHHVPASTSAPLLRQSGGPIFDDTSSSVNNDSSYTAIAANDANQGLQSFACLAGKKDRH